LTLGHILICFNVQSSHEKLKSTSANERFGGRRGVTRGTLYRYFGSSPPVLTFASPRPTAKPPGVGCKQTEPSSSEKVYYLYVEY